MKRIAKAFGRVANDGFTLGYDPSATCVCDGCHRKFTGHRYVAPPIHRRLPDHMVDLLCPRCAKGRDWSPPFDLYKETKHGH